MRPVHQLSFYYMWSWSLASVTLQSRAYLFKKGGYTVRFDIVTGVYYILALNNLAIFYTSKKMLREAFLALKECLTLQRSVYPERHPRVAKG